MTSSEGGGGGFQYGDDFVAARVSIDIPTEGIAGLREITQEMDRFRTSVEAANRSSDTFSGYLNRIAEAANQAAQAQQNVIGMLERSNEYQNQLVTGGAGGPAPRLQAGRQYENPFEAAQAGLGTSDRMPTTIPEATAQMASLRGRDPRAYINRMAASGQVQPGDIPSNPSGEQIQETANRIAQRTQEHERQSGGGMVSGGTEGVAQQILNEMSPARGGGAGMGGVGTNPRIPATAGGGGGGLGGLLGGLLGGPGAMKGLAGLGTAGAVGGGVLAALAAVQEGGEIYQGAKNMGLTRGGGASEGLGYEANIRAMALNPFISTDQARQIVQQGLRDGYTGKEFDTVTGFVAQNLKDLNMDISQSFDLVKKNAKEGGQTIEGLGIALDSLKEASKTGYRSLPELIKGYQQTSSSLITGGMSGPAASREAMISANTFSDNAAAAGTMDQAVQAMANNPRGQALMMYQGGGALGDTSGLLPGAAFFMEGGGQGVTQALENVLKQRALQFWNSARRPLKGTKPYANAALSWYRTIQQMGVPWTPQQAKTWFDAFIEGKSPVAEGAEKTDETMAEQLKPRDRGIMGDISGFIAGNSSQMLGSAKVFGGAIADFFTGKWQGADEYVKKHDAVTERANAMADPGLHINALDRVRDAYAEHGGVEFVDQNGKVVRLNQSNAAQMDQLSQGQLKVRQRGSEASGFTLQQAAGMTSEQIRELGGVIAKNSTVSGTLHVTIDPAAQRAGVSAPSAVQLTPHEQQANAGYGQATPNNAPPGFKTPRR